MRERELEIKAMEDRLARARPALPGLPRAGRVVVPRLPGLHDEAEAGLREVQRAARGALADLPALRDARHVAEPARDRHDAAGDLDGALGGGRRVRLSRLRRRWPWRRHSCSSSPTACTAALAGEILTRLERRGFELRGARLLKIPRSLAQQHYAEHKGKPFFGDLVTFITSGPVLALAVRGESAISVVRTMMGATNPLDSAPGTIRGDFALELSENIVHGSDSKASAKRELALFFPDGLV